MDLSLGWTQSGTGTSFIRWYGRASGDLFVGGSYDFIEHIHHSVIRLQLRSEWQFSIFSPASCVENAF